MIRTWHAEIAVVATVLAAVAAFAGGGWVEWIGAAAVTASFAHGQTADRLAESQAAQARPDVECYRWTTRYFVLKEGLWLLYFLLHRSYAALAGVGLFLAYPAWRSWWRKRHPRRA